MPPPSQGGKPTEWQGTCSVASSAAHHIDRLNEEGRKRFDDAAKIRLDQPTVKSNSRPHRRKMVASAAARMCWPHTAGNAVTAFHGRFLIRIPVTSMPITRGIKSCGSGKRSEQVRKTRRGRTIRGEQTRAGHSRGRLSTRRAGLKPTARPCTRQHCLVGTPYRCRRTELKGGSTWLRAQYTTVYLTFNQRGRRTSIDHRAQDDESQIVLHRCGENSTVQGHVIARALKPLVSDPRSTCTHA